MAGVQALRASGHPCELPAPASRAELTAGLQGKAAPHRLNDSPLATGGWFSERFLRKKLRNLPGKYFTPFLLSNKCGFILK